MLSGSLRKQKFGAIAKERETSGSLIFGRGDEASELRDTIKQSIATNNRIVLNLADPRGDDGDTEAKLDDISRKADELAAKHPELKVRIEVSGLYELTR